MKYNLYFFVLLLSMFLPDCLIAYAPPAGPSLAKFKLSAEARSLHLDGLIMEYRNHRDNAYAVAQIIRNVQIVGEENEQHLRIVRQRRLRVLTQDLIRMQNYARNVEIRMRTGLL